jgi:hypothetical protein
MPPWAAAQDRPKIDAEERPSDIDNLEAVNERSGGRRSISKRRWSPILIGGAAIMMAAAGGAIFTSVFSDGQSDKHVQSHAAGVTHARRRGQTYPEEEYNKNGASTFRFLNGSSPGQPLEFEEFVQVSCKIYNPTLQSARPDGYWYRISSFPWDNHYYAVANTFLNGDPPGGPYTHDTDFKVPNC